MQSPLQVYPFCCTSIQAFHLLLGCLRCCLIFVSRLSHLLPLKMTSLICCSNERIIHSCTCNYGSESDIVRRPLRIKSASHTNTADRVPLEDPDMCLRFCCVMIQTSKNVIVPSHGNRSLFSAKMVGQVTRFAAGFCQSRSAGPRLLDVE